MFKTIYILVLLTSSVTLTSCQNIQSDDQLAKQNIEYTDTVEESNVDAPLVNSDKPCKASSPPIKDKNKIKIMLINSGKVTTDMPELQADKVVRDYIKKKQDTFKYCKK